jgi:polyhydroxybutyrate depolymerase
MANRAACDLADVFAAAAPVSGAHQYSSSCSPGRPVPVLGIHGATDSVVPLGGYAGVPAAADWIVGWATRNGCGSTTPEQSELSGAAAFAFPGCPASGETVLVVVPGLGHTWWSGANDAVTSFFDRHALP